MVQEILKHLTSFLEGKTSHEEFENWFLPATWNVRQETDPEGYALAGQVALALAEFDDKHLDDYELADRLSELAKASGVARTGGGR